MRYRPLGYLSAKSGEREAGLTQPYDFPCVLTERPQMLRQGVDAAAARL